MEAGIESDNYDFNTDRFKTNNTLMNAANTPNYTRFHLSKIRYCLVISFYKKSLKIEIHSQPVHCTLANCICVYLPWRPTEN